MTDEERKADARDRMRRYRARHAKDPIYKARVREEKRKQLAKNPERRKENGRIRVKRYRDKNKTDPTFKAKAIARASAWRAIPENKVRHDMSKKVWALAHPDCSREASKRYRAHHDAHREREQKRPGYSAAAAAKRRFQKRQATPAWSDIAAIEFVYKEAKVKSATEGAPFHVDHIVPLKHKLVCGLHVPANLQILPGIENIRKNNRFEIT